MHSIHRDSLSAVGKKVSINLLDIVSLIKRIRVRSEDFLFVKMDVEGMEYEIMRRLITSGVLTHLIDKIAVEWYESLRNLDKYDHVSKALPICFIII